MYRIKAISNKLWVLIDPRGKQTCLRTYCVNVAQDWALSLNADLRDRGLLEDS